MSEPKRILIGEITTAHGIKGFVKIRSFVDDESLFEDESVFTSETGNGKIKLSLKNALKGDWLAQVDGVADRNAAEALRGTQLYVDRSSLPEADDGEFYIEDLKGMKVVNDQGSDIGTVIDIVNFGASDLLDMKPASGGATFYLPFTKDTIINIDFNNSNITVLLPETI